MKLFDRLFKSSDDLVEIATQYLFGLGDKDANIWPAYIKLNDKCYNGAILLFEGAAELGDKEAILVRYNY